MQITRHITPRTTRLVAAGALDTSPIEVCFLACHGYGMNVERFARWFEVLPKGYVALCPEGLSRFYWGGFTGRHVSSWMTSEERLHEIDDFCGWMDQAYQEAKRRFPKARILPFGFSQGAATVMRWLQRSRPAIDGLILWSGAPPEDIDYAPLAYFHRLKPQVWWGTSDELVTWEVAATRFADVPLEFAKTDFSGGHRIEAAALLALAESLRLSNA